MALPKLATATYELELPSTAEIIKYRPFLVKEQKVLMMASESKEDKQIVEAVKNIIKSCTFDKLDVNKLPMFDIEYIFIKLRAKSVGETAKISVTCPDDNKTRAIVNINLDELDMTVKDDHSNKINITDDVSITMNYPLIDDFKDFDKGQGSTGFFDLIKKCIDEVIEGETIHKRIDFTNEDLNEFIDSLNSAQLSKIMKFYETMPRLRHVVEVENPKTKVKSEVVIEGLANFLA
tara:strand:- start:1295 stop:1999 length:705 start_codon:yes stop_codon:yes gene_type:complete